VKLGDCHRCPGYQAPRNQTGLICPYQISHRQQNASELQQSGCQRGNAECENLQNEGRRMLHDDGNYEYKTREVMVIAKLGVSSHYSFLFKYRYDKRAELYE
jgi:hypothetical protein